MSVSASPSISPSVSPSSGYELYTRGDYADLPADDTNLENSYSAQDYLDVNEDDGTRVGQTATSQHAIHEFKDFVGDETAVTLLWNGQSTQAPSVSTVYLQIYNQNTTEWDAVDNDSTTAADTDFDLTGAIADLTDYKSDGMISCRVYQEMT